MKRKVALWGMPEDEPLQAVRRELSQRSAPYVMLDQAESIEEVGAVFVRPREVRSIELEQRLFVWADIAPILVMNRTSAGASNGSKPWQLELIRERGFEVPATLVTTSPQAVHAFIAEHRQVIYKSVSGQRSVVTRVDASRLGEIDHVTNCPTQFQAYIAGTDWRVHVVGCRDDCIPARLAGSIPGSALQRTYMDVAGRTGMAFAAMDLACLPARCAGVSGRCWFCERGRNGGGYTGVGSHQFGAG